MTSELQRFKNMARDSGDLFLPQPIRRFLYTHIIGSPTSLLYISYWSILHMLSGALTGILLLCMSANYKIRLPYYFTGVFVHTLWELWQKFIGMTQWDLRGSIDTIVDTVMYLAGMVVVHLIP